MIHVIDDYVIDSDGTQYTMGRAALRKNRKTGAEELFIRDPSFHSSFASALMAINRRMRCEAIRRSEGSLADALTVLKETDEALINAISAFDGIRVEGR